MGTGTNLLAKGCFHPSDAASFAEYPDDIIKNVEERAGREPPRKYNDHIRKEYSIFNLVMEGLIKQAEFEAERALSDHGIITTYDMQAGPENSLPLTRHLSLTAFVPQ